MDRPQHILLFCAALALLVGVLTGCDLLTSDETRMERAKELRVKGNYRTAVIELKKVLQNNPKNKDARLLLGQVSLEVGQVAAAEKELRRAYDLGVPFDQVAIPIGQALLVQGDYDLLLDELDPAIVESKDIKVGILMLRGDAYIATDKLQDAERTFREALKLDPESVDGRIGLAEVARVMGDFDGADAHIKDALSRHRDSVAAWLAKGRLEFGRAHYAQAEDAFAQSLNSSIPQPTRLQEFVARNGLAESQWRQGKSDEAVDNIERAIRLAPNHPRPKYFRALIAYGAGDYETAVRQLQLVLRLYPNYRQVQLLLGATHYARGNLEQADMYLSSVLAADPSSVRARKLLAATRIRKQKPDDALSTLRPAVSQGTNDQQLLALMSRASFQAGDTDGGILYLEQGLQTDPDDEAMQMELAAGYLTAGELEQAIKILEKLPETKEGAYRRELLLVLAYLRKQDIANALAEAQKLVASHPNDTGAHNLLGSVHMVAGQLPQARQSFDKALQLQPENLALLLNLGRLEFREGKQDAARDRFEHVLKINPKNVNAMLALAQLSATRGDQQQVTHWLERAIAAEPQAPGPKLLLVRHYLVLRDIDKARALATKLAEEAPKNAEVQNALGIVHMTQRQYREAVASFTKAAQLSPKIANFYYNLARAQLALQNFGEAKQALSKTLKLQPDNLRATAALATIEMREGNAKQALARARRLQENKRTRAAGFALEGDLHMMQRDYRSAVRAYDMADRDINSGLLAIKSYQAHRRAKMPDATKPLEQWLVTYPNDARVRLVLAQDYQALGHIKKATTEYERLLEISPTNAIILNNLAWLYHEQKDPRAIPTAERAHQAQPQNGGVTDTLGWLLVQQGQVERGLELLRQAAKQAPRIPDIRYHLGVALAKSGASEEARQTLTELVNSGVNFKELPEAKRLLQQL